MSQTQRVSMVSVEGRQEFLQMTWCHLCQCKDISKLFAFRGLRNFSGWTIFCKDCAMDLGMMGLAEPNETQVTQILPDQYQTLAAKTECDQTRSVARISCRLTADTRNFHEDQLRLIRLNHGAIGVSKEAGEILSLLEKCVYYGQNLESDKVKDELGDVMWYTALVCNALGISLSEVMEANIRKLKVRYPDRYTDYACANRDRDKEHQAITQNQSNAGQSSKGCKQCQGTGKVADEWSKELTDCPICHGLGLVSL